MELDVPKEYEVITEYCSYWGINWETEVTRLRE